MLHVLSPRLVVSRQTLLRSPKGIDACCARSGRRHLSTAAEPSKPASGSPSDDEPGWPLKYKLAGGAFLGTLIPWMFSYAVANDPGSRRLVGKLSPGLVQWFRKRQEGGHFFDEDTKRIAYLAEAPEWIERPVTIEVRIGSGETRRLQALDARLPFSSVAGLVRADGGDSSGGGGAVGWLTDFDVVDEEDSGEDEEMSSSWETSSSGGGGDRYEDDSSSSRGSKAVRRDVAACNIRSWWDIAALEEERARQPAPEVAAAASASASWRSAARTTGFSATPPTQRMSDAAQAWEMIDHLDKVVDSLEKDKLTGARSIDDVEDEVREIRKQQKELRRKLPGRRRFLGLF